MSRRVAVVNEASGRVLASRVELADGWWSRLRGLIGREPPGPDGGLLLLDCPAVHTWGMSYPIDVALLGSDGRVLSIHPGLRPRGRTPWRTGARHTLELRAGRIAEAEIQRGDRLSWRPSDERHPQPEEEA